MPTSPKGSVEATHVWKGFRSDRRRMHLRDEIQRLAALTRGEHPKAWRWVLRDVGFKVAAGEALGLVGINGSGKSSLLKILSGVMYPHSGTVKAEGRIGALIEVRAGLHPDLSGRENITLSGSLLGLSRRDVQSRFDDIVAFAELETAIDRQLKFYSSGMQMRLGFGVAAFLEPDILLVDEILTVGDASFQQKCLNRMREVLNNGTTLIFVSHELAAVQATCRTGLWLHDGAVRQVGPIGEVLGGYKEFIEESAESTLRVHGTIELLKLEVNEGTTARTGGPLAVNLTLHTDSLRAGVLLLGVSDGPPAPIFLLTRQLTLPVGDTDVRCRLPQLPLPGGRYFLWVGVFRKGRELLPWHPAARFEVMGPNLESTPLGIVRQAPIHVESRWDVNAAGN